MLAIGTIKPPDSCPCYEVIDHKNRIKYSQKEGDGGEQDAGFMLPDVSL